MDKNVYVVNRGPHNYEEAKGFGDLVYCTDGSLDRYDTAQMYRELKDAMQDSQPEDYLLITSLTSLCCVASAILAAKHQVVNFLIHSKESGYVARSVHLKGL